MRRLLQRVFFHMGFWPRAFSRWVFLLFSSDFLKVKELDIDQAYYIQGSWVRLQWEVENSWLVRVNHPGGFYRGSDMTWFVAEQGMAPVEITVYGLRKRDRRRFDIHVKPYPRKAEALTHLSASLDTMAIHAGPRLNPRGKQLVAAPLNFNSMERPLSHVPGHPGTVERVVNTVFACKDLQSLEALRGQHFPTTESPNLENG